MEQYIPKDVLLAEIDRQKIGYNVDGKHSVEYDTTRKILNILDTLEVKEVDLEKLREIARHLIAVKENIEDMRLDNSEWNLLKRIGYPESNKAQKGE